MKKKTITRKEKKFRSVGICTTYYSSVTKRRETQRFYTSFINTGLYKYNHLSLSYISSTSTDAVPNKYISKPSIPKRTWSNFLSLFFASVNILPSKKKKKVRPRSTKLTFITKQYEHRTRTAQRPPAGSCQVLHPRQKKLD